MSLFCSIFLIIKNFHNLPFNKEKTSVFKNLFKSTDVEQHVEKLQFHCHIFSWFLKKYTSAAHSFYPKCHADVATETMNSRFHISKLKVYLNNGVSSLILTFFRFQQDRINMLTSRAVNKCLSRNLCITFIFQRVAALNLSITQDIEDCIIFRLDMLFFS